MTDKKYIVFMFEILKELKKYFICFKSKNNDRMEL